MGGVILETESERLIREGYKQGIEQCERNGYELGEVQAQRKFILNLLNDGQNTDAIARLCDCSVGLVMEVRDSMVKTAKNI